MRNLIRRWETLAACGALAAGALVVGLASSSSAASVRPRATKETVAFIPGATGVGFYNGMLNGVRAQAKKYGWSVIYEGSPDFTPSAQTPVVEAVCARHPAALLIAPTDPVAMEPAVKQCMKEGVLIVTVDTALANTSGIVAAISSDNIQGGETAAKFIAQQLKGSGQVATLSLTPTATTQVLRVKGFVQEMKAHYPKISIVASEFTGQALTGSETDASAVLSAHPQVKAFFGAAEPNGEGAALAGKGKHLVIVSYDADPPTIALVKSGAISATIAQQPALEGQIGVQDVYDYLTGHKSLIKKSVLLPNILITTASARSGVDAKYYYPAG